MIHHRPHRPGPHRPAGGQARRRTLPAPSGRVRLVRRHAAPGAKPLTVYGWRGKGHLPALLRRPL